MLVDAVNFTVLKWPWLWWRHWVMWEPTFISLTDLFRDPNSHYLERYLTYTCKRRLKASRSIRLKAAESAAQTLWANRELNYTKPSKCRSWQMSALLQLAGSLFDIQRETRLTWLWLRTQDLQLFFWSKRLQVDYDPEIYSSRNINQPWLSEKNCWFLSFVFK